MRNDLSLSMYIYIYVCIHIYIYTHNIYIYIHVHIYILYIYPPEYTLPNIILQVGLSGKVEIGTLRVPQGFGPKVPI